MNGEARRERILQLLQQQELPLSGTAIARACQVSRQVIVQDIALMRAENRAILSTNKGYLLQRETRQPGWPRQVVCVRHSDSQVLDEFQTVLNLGGKILDVAVEHALYGQIRVDLLIENQQDAEDFVRRLSCCRDNPLKALTDDCHYHTIAAPSRQLLELICRTLKEKGYLLSPREEGDAPSPPEG